MFRRIENPYFSQPVGEFQKFGNNEDNLVVDSQGNIFEIIGTKYYKLGYISPFVENIFKYVPAVGFGVLIANLFFPVRSQNRNSDVSFVMAIFIFVIGLIFLYGVFIGWLVNVVLMNRFDEVIKLIENHKIMRLFCPNYWFTGNAKITGYLHLGAPVFLILTILTFILSGGDYNNVAGTLCSFNFFSLVVSLICIVLDFFYNLLAKVTKY